jgi:hypothetical protein
MRFQYQKDEKLGLWCVVDSHAGDNCVSSHKTKSAAILSMFWCEDIWAEHQAKNGAQANLA